MPSFLASGVPEYPVSDIVAVTHKKQKIPVLHNWPVGDQRFRLRNTCSSTIRPTTAATVPITTSTLPPVDRSRQSLRVSFDSPVVEFLVYTCSDSPFGRAALNCCLKRSCLSRDFRYWAVDKRIICWALESGILGCTTLLYPTGGVVRVSLVIPLAPCPFKKSRSDSTASSGRISGFINQ